MINMFFNSFVNHAYLTEEQCGGWSIDRSGNGYDDVREDKP